MVLVEGRIFESKVAAETRAIDVWSACENICWMFGVLYASVKAMLTESWMEHSRAA